MTPASAPWRFRTANHVGSSSAAGAPGRARPLQAGRDPHRRPARGRGPGDPRRGPDAGGRRHAGRHRRRIPAHVLPRRLPRAARWRGRRGGGDGQVPQPAGRRRVRATGHEGDRQGPSRAANPGARLSVPGLGDAPDAQGLNPVADDAALPRRARRHDARAYPDLEGFFEDVAAAYRAEIRALAPRAAATCSSTTASGCPVRQSAATARAARGCMRSGTTIVTCAPARTSPSMIVRLPASTAGISTRLSCHCS